MQRAWFTSCICPLVPALVLSLVSAGQSAIAASKFDGIWAVTLVCPGAADGAEENTFRFPAEVKDGVLHNEHGSAKAPGWLSLDGMISLHGAAILFAHGLTGRVYYNVGFVPQQAPYSYLVVVRFDPAHGSGTRTQICPCTIEFEKT